jgi:putative transposase
MRLFEKDDDHEAFEQALLEAWQRVGIRILGYVVMPDHWEFVVWPKTDEQTSEFFYRLTLTHTMRWHAHHETVGSGHLYQGRFKSFPVQKDERLLTVLQYVESSPLRAGLAERAEDWRWGSAWRACRGKPEHREILSAWPAARPRQWKSQVNSPLSASELAALESCVRRGSPYGDERWVERTAAALGLQFTLRSRGRPPKERPSARESIASG